MKPLYQAVFPILGSSHSILKTVKILKKQTFDVTNKSHLRLFYIIINQKSIIMKNSITMLAIALTVYGNTVFANTSKSPIVSKSSVTAVTILSKHAAYNDLDGVKYVSYADTNLMAAELGSLKKSPKTIAEIIGADLKITEAKISKKVVLKKKQSKKQTFKKVLSN